MGIFDFAQSASNAAASNITGPVDLLTLLLQKAGLPVPDNAVGGSKWMEQKGLLKPVPQSASSLAGETMGLIGPMVAAAKAPEIARGLLKMGENAAAPRTLNPQLGAIVYHGSPHKFDKFDSSKIGTGEGAQAYGHGLYLAESPDVAKQYATNVKDMGTVARINAELSDLAKAMAKDEVPGAYRKYRTEAGAAAARKYDELMALKEAVRKDPGTMYKVDLPDTAIARMLDWDKPLKDQPENVKSAMSDLANKLTGYFGNSMNGDQMLRHLQSTLKSIGLGHVKAEKVLYDHGIPGIRYLDGGSRGAGTGTSNYVVFPGEEGLLKILERNGMAP